MANTGNKIYTTLLKVTNDINQYPLDVNNDLCSISNLAQAAKANTFGETDYISPIPDSTSCPITGPPAENNAVQLQISTSDIAICSTIPETYYTTGGAFSQGVSIYMNNALTIEYNGNGSYVLLSTSGIIHTLALAMVGQTTGESCAV
jgi:hypothetical protein